MKIVAPQSGAPEYLAALSEGRILAYPTETFYGFGVDAENLDALERLSQLKQRDPNVPFPVLLPGIEALSKYVREVPSAAIRLIHQFWPGPLTLVLPSDRLAAPCRNAAGGVGFRVSSHPIAAQIVRAFGRALTSTSANRSGEPPARTTAELQKHFQNADMIVVDGGPVPGEKPSTVVDFTAPVGPRLIREGMLPWSRITALL